MAEGLERVVLRPVLAIFLPPLPLPHPRLQYHV